MGIPTTCSLLAVTPIFLYTDSCYNVSFDGTRLKEQCYLTGNCNRIRRSSTGRGRQTDSFQDVSISGQNAGFMEILSSDPDASSATTSTGGLLLRVPDNNTATVGNLATAYNSVLIDEENGVNINIQYSGSSGAMSDDTAYSFTPPKSSGIMMLSNGAGQNARFCFIAYNTSSGTAADAGYVGSVMNLTTGALTGTDGTDTKINVSAHTDGKIYIENRSGASHTMYWTLFR